MVYESGERDERDASKICESQIHNAVYLEQIIPKFDSCIVR